MISLIKFVTNSIIGKHNKITTQVFKPNMTHINHTIRPKFHTKLKEPHHKYNEITNGKQLKLGIVYFKDHFKSRFNWNNDFSLWNITTNPSLGNVMHLKKVGLLRVYPN